MDVFTINDERLMEVLTDRAEGDEVPLHELSLDSWSGEELCTMVSDFLTEMRAEGALVNPDLWA